MYVITVDQRDSRSTRDRVPELLERYSVVSAVRPFDRTAGDEVQAVFDSPGDLGPLAVELVESGFWSVGIGVGAVELPLPEQTRAGRGRAFEAAREAVESAKSQRIPLRIVGGSPWCAHAQTAAWLLIDLLGDRSAAGREAVAAVRAAPTQAAAAADLAITPQAMSSRLRRARWDLEQPAALLLRAALEAAS